MHMGLFFLRFFLICAASLLLAWLRPAIAGAQPTSIFVLHSYSADYPWSKGQQQGFVQALGADLHSPGGEGLAAFDLRIAYLDTKHTPYTPAYARQTANYFKLRYAGYQPAAVYVTDDNALNFVQAHIDDIFPGVPVFFSGVNDLGVKNSLIHNVLPVFSSKRKLLPILIWSRKWRAITKTSCCSATPVKPTG